MRTEQLLALFQAFIRPLLEEIHRLYTENGMSQKQIEEKFNYLSKVQDMEAEIVRNNFNNED